MTKSSGLYASDEVLEAMAMASRRLDSPSRALYEVLGHGRQVLGLGRGPQVLDNWLPHNNFTFCNYSIK